MQKRHYRSLFNIFRACYSPFQFLFTYLTGKGTFPTTIQIASPLKTLSLTLYNFHDLLTVNEIFCRKDYEAATDLSCIVDLGANIGISLSYFLSHNPNTKAYAYEPVTENLAKLKRQLEANGFTERVELFEKAVSDFSGVASFGTEPSGRYGGLGLSLRETIEVEVVEINFCLEKILAKHPRINLLKVDTEGSEMKIIQAIRPDLLNKIDLIYAESLAVAMNTEGLFSVEQSGTVTTYRHLQFKK